MSQESLEEWLGSRRPGIPSPLLACLLDGKGHPPTPQGLMLMGAKALENALGSPGKNRRAAHELLAADAFLTYACEAAAGSRDPREALEGLVVDLGKLFSP